MGGSRRLAKTKDMRSGPRVSSSRTTCRMSAESSTRWKSSKTMALGSGGSADELAEERLEHRLERRRRRGGLGQQRSRRCPELGQVDANRGDQVGDEARPVAVPAIEAKPQHPQSGAPREIGKQRRLAIARLGGQQDGPTMDLDGQPVEQAIARERLLAQRRCLDLADLDRELGHRAEGPSGGREAGGYAGGTTALDDQPRSPPSGTSVGGPASRGRAGIGVDRLSVPDGPIGRRER